MVCSFHSIQYSRGNGKHGSSLSHSTYRTVHCTHTHTHTHNGPHTRTVLIIHQGRKEGRGQHPDGGDGEQGRCSAGDWWDNLSACDEIQLRPSALQNSNTGNFLFAACKNIENIFKKRKQYSCWGTFNIFRCFESESLARPSGKTQVLQLNFFIEKARQRSRSPPLLVQTYI